MDGEERPRSIYPLGKTPYRMYILIRDYRTYGVLLVRLGVAMLQSLDAVYNYGNVGLVQVSGM